MHPLHTALRSTRIMQGSMPSHPIEVGLCANHVLFRGGRNGEKECSPWMSRDMSFEHSLINLNLNRVVRVTLNA